MGSREAAAQMLASVQAPGRVDPFASVTNYATTLDARTRAEAAVAYQKERDAVTDAKAAEMMQMAKAQEARAVADDIMKRSTREAYAKADTLLGAPGMLASQAQALAGSNVNGEFSNKLLLEAQKIAERSTLLTNPDGTTSSVYAKGDEKRFDEIQAKLGASAQAAITKNDSTLEGKRALLMEQAPVSELYTVDPTTQEVKTLSDIDVSDQLKLKEARIGDIDTKIAARDAILNAKEMQQAGFRHAEGMADIANKRAIALAKATTVGKFEDIQLTAFTTKDGKPSATPTNYKVNITAKNPQQLEYYKEYYSVKGADGKSTSVLLPGKADGEYKAVLPKSAYATKAGIELDMGSSDTPWNLKMAQRAIMANPSADPEAIVQMVKARSNKNWVTDKVDADDLNIMLQNSGLNKFK